MLETTHNESYGLEAVFLWLAVTAVPGMSVSEGYVHDYGNLYNFGGKPGGKWKTTAFIHVF